MECVAVHSAGESRQFRKHFRGAGWRQDSARFVGVELVGVGVGLEQSARVFFFAVVFDARRRRARHPDASHPSRGQPGHARLDAARSFRDRLWHRSARVVVQHSQRTSRNIPSRRDRKLRARAVHATRSGSVRHALGPHQHCKLRALHCDPFDLV